MKLICCGVDGIICGGDKGVCGIVLYAWVSDVGKDRFEPHTAGSRCVPDDQSCLTLNGEENGNMEEVVEDSPDLLTDTSPAVLFIGIFGDTVEVKNIDEVLDQLVGVNLCDTTRTYDKDNGRHDKTCFLPYRNVSSHNIVGHRLCQPEDSFSHYD